jgi:hypothetical protein
VYEADYSTQPTAAISGGTRIENLDRNNYGCTAGFSYRNSTGDYGFFTAGHCAVNQGERFGAPGFGQNYYRTFGSIVGVAPGARLYPDENTDSTVIPAPAADTTNVSGWVVINRAAGFHDDQVGVLLCTYGATTGTQRCGSVVVKGEYLPNVAFDLWGTRDLRDTRRVDYGCGAGPQLGDSGAPVYSGDGGAFGLQSRLDILRPCSPQYGWYTHVRYAMEKWGVTVPR